MCAEFQLLYQTTFLVSPKRPPPCLPLSHYSNYTVGLIKLPGDNKEGGVGLGTDSIPAYGTERHNSSTFEEKKLTKNADYQSTKFLTSKRIFFHLLTWHH